MVAIAANAGGKIKLGDNVPVCPSCRQPGQKVNLNTVRSLIKQALADQIMEDDYFICLSPACSTAYYTSAGSHFAKDDLNVPIWYKESSPVPICYCKDVSDAEILDHIVNKQCCTNLEDIQAHTGANTGKECLSKNPTGK